MSAVKAAQLPAKNSTPSMPFVTRQLQRKCACGASPGFSGQCTECKKKQLQRSAFPGATREASLDREGEPVPPIVHEVLATPGQALDPSSSFFMRSRFGHDFSQVRVHADARAAQSARALNALAYTVGTDVVFGAGQYAPHTGAGRHLLAHELAHIRQQRGVSGSAQDIELASKDSAHEREADHIADEVMGGRGVVSAPSSSPAPSVQRACGPRAIGSVSGCVGRSGELTTFGGSSANLYLFKVNCDEFAPGEEARLRTFAAGIAPDDTLHIDGFASEEGDPVFNENLSCARAWAVWNVLAQEGVTVQPSLYMHGATQGIRTMQRSAVITQIPASAPPEEEKKPKHLCGPDVTAQVADVLSYTRTLFGGWSRAQKGSACSALVEPPEAAFAWDILDLHRNAWILQYRCSPPSASCPVGTTVPPNPVCASWGASPQCGSTVQVGKECYYAGSANYVVFGVMCKLCSNEFGGPEFSESAVRFLVNLYKLGGAAGSNVSAARAWASAGYHGWPSGGTPPSGDRSNCSPTCPTAYQGSAFTISWCPLENPYAECTSPAAAIESILEHVF